MKEFVHICHINEGFMVYSWCHMVAVNVISLQLTAWLCVHSYFIYTYIYNLHTHIHPAISVKHTDYIHMGFINSAVCMHLYVCTYIYVHIILCVHMHSHMYVAI